MGLDITRNDEGLYRLISTVSDECYHPDKEWIDEDEVKRILIYNHFHKFVEKVIEIEMSFPNNYRVNDCYQRDESKQDFNEWFLKALKSDDIDQIINDKFKEVYEKLKLEIKIT
jgi:hypothetical protein